MSGGVDSSVTTLLLKNQGYDVTGVFMRCYNIDGCAGRDAWDAKQVADKIGIPFYVWDFEEEYKRRVVGYMIEGYRQGLTPNPDVECNREIKFGLFLDKALKEGGTHVATGHYVKIRKNHPFGTSGSRVPATRAHLHSPRPHLLEKEDQAVAESESSLKNNFSEFSLFEGKDKGKDQSYFLWTLTQEQLKHCLFPIGDYLKSEVREMARKAGLATAEKKDSQGICFLGKVTMGGFLKEYLPEKRGEVLSVAGEKLGEHNGAHFYTIGQRSGIGNLKHQKGVKLHKPLYVAAKDVVTNTVTVARSGDESLTRQEVELTGVNFINENYKLRIMNNEEIKVMARVRYRQPLAKAKIQQIVLLRQGYGGQANRKSQTLKLIFDEPQRFVAAGQSAVFYLDDGVMLGGGVIV